MVLGTVAAVGSVVVAVAAGPAVAVAVGVGSTASATVGGGSAVAVATVTPGVGTAVAGFASHVITSAAAPLITSGPIGWITLGADGLSWDCWKPILRDSSAEPSKGRLLRDVVLDSRVKEVKVVEKEDGAQLIQLKNIWGEHFNVHFVMVDGEMAAHASKIYNV